MKANQQELNCILENKNPMTFRFRFFVQKYLILLSLQSHFTYLYEIQYKINKLTY